MAVLTSKQRKFLRGLAHPLSPVVRVGKGGVTDSLVAETRKSIESHELIKVRVELDEGAERQQVAEALAGAVDAQLAGMIGKIAILYRQRDEDAEIKLPT